MAAGSHARRRRRLHEDFADDEALGGLAEAYCEHPIVLYIGAGVSVGGRIETRGEPRAYGLPPWIGLLREIVRSSGGDASKMSAADPWDAADQAVAACGGLDAFRTSLRNVISRPENYVKTNGQLNGHFVRCATTLAAVAAFCSRLVGTIRQEAGEKRSRVFFVTAPNPRVSAVITANYDCFLESASSNLFRKAKLKPVTAFGSLAGPLSRIPVFHVHGFVPHPFWQREGDRIPLVPDLVITRQDYERAWNPGDVFGTTMGTQVYHLRHFTTLFVGFSFRDEYVCRLLERIHSEVPARAPRSHYALLRRDEIDPALMQRLGVRPIAWTEPGDIAKKLGRLYQAGLSCDHDGARQIRLPELTKRTHLPAGKAVEYSLSGYWDVLSACRNEGVPRSLLHMPAQRVVGTPSASRV